MQRNTTFPAWVPNLLVTVLVLGLTQSPVSAKDPQNGPLAEILQRLDDFVQELESLDVQTETLENPAVEDLVLDALSVRLCSKLAAGGSLGASIKPVTAEGKFGGGLGPNLMGTGLEVKIKPQVSGNATVDVKTSLGVSSLACFDLYKAARIIQKGIENDAPITPADPLFAEFVRQLDANARAKIQQFATYSPAGLLDLMVAMLKDAGIDPTVDPDSLTNSIVASLESMDNFANDLRPDAVLDQSQFNAILANVPMVGTGMRTAIDDAVGALTNASVDPCGPNDLPLGLGGLRDDLCSASRLFTDLSWFGPLDRIDDADTGLTAVANAVEQTAGEVQGSAQSIKSRMDTLFGQIEDIFNGVAGNICKEFSDGVSAGPCHASVSFNPCDITSIDIDIGC